MVEFLYLGAFIAAALIALILTPIARRLALAFDFIDHPGERKIHTEPIAYGGGFALAFAVALTLGAVLLLKRYNIVPLGSVTEDLRGWPLFSVCLGALGVLILGFIDDKYKLSPYAKLAGQFVLAAGVVAGGVRVTAFVGDNLAMQALTVCWIVFVTNSFNLLDNMDGLCAGTVAIAAAMLGLVALDSSQWNLMTGLAALAGACVGFFKFNRAPARIFLGDTGALFAGFVMACATGMVTYYQPNKASHLAIGIPLLILAIPLYDTLSVIYIRLKERRPVMRGDTSHFSHRLVDLGMSRRQAATTIHLACLAIGLPATTLGKLSPERGMLIIGQAVLVLTIIALLEHAGRARAARTRDATPITPEAEKNEVKTRETQDVGRR